MGFFRDLIFNGLNDLTNAGHDIVSDPTGGRELESKSCIRCANCSIKNVELSYEPYGVAHVLYCSGCGSEKYGVIKEYGTASVITSLEPLEVTTSCSQFVPSCEIGEESPLQYQWQGLAC